MFETDLSGQPVVVEDLDAEWVLALLEDKEAAAREAERGKLRLAARWCVLHPASADTGVATWGGPGLLESDESLGGDGTPAIAAFAPEPFAAALGVSTTTGMQLIADGLDLQHRLPRIWRRVEALEVAPWKARKVAQATHVLSRAAAAYVDGELAARLDSCGAVLIERVVAMAVAKHHPELLAERERKGKAGWQVRLHHPGAGEFAGTSHLDVTGDTLDLTKFYDLVCDQAAALAALGDDDPLEVRKAKALGVIADQQASLDLLALVGDQEPGPTGTGRAATTRFYLHFSLSDLVRFAEPQSATAVGEVEKFGPATIAKIREWVGHSRVTVQPVLDLGCGDAVDRHEPPAWMRELVILRDRHCVFPFCHRPSRSCDLDHIDPYDDTGPPGQTRPDTWLRSADDITGARRPGAGGISDIETTPISGPGRTVAGMPSPRPAPSRSSATDDSVRLERSHSVAALPVRLLGFAP